MSAATERAKRVAKMRTIRVNDRYVNKNPEVGTRSVRAEIVTAEFAIHRSCVLGGSSRRFTVTHIRTGFAVVTFVRKPSARSLAITLQTKFGAVFAKIKKPADAKKHGDIGAWLASWKLEHADE